MSQTRAAIVGCGYAGQALARALRAQGARVLGTARTDARRADIERTGAEFGIVDVMEPASLRQLADWDPTVVFDLVRPQTIGDDRYTTRGTRNLADALLGRPLDALVYLSSTSVYGRRSGEWTDERTPAEPSSPLGVARVESEAIYLEGYRTLGLPARVCRAPGIYGPGRTLRARLQSGAYRLLDDDQLWVSRIHVEDLADGLIAAWRRGAAGETYLLCDDEPVTGREYAELTAQLLALPLPPTVDREDIRGELSVSAFERRVGARRCSNRRMREELRVALRYPTVREGIPAALRAEGAL